jgi:excisionase family DNA binding protein
MRTHGHSLENANRGAPLMDIEAVAARLGVNVRHVRRLVSERRIPYLKWGHLVRFDPCEIAAWLDAARRPLLSDVSALDAVRRHNRLRQAAVPQAGGRRHRRVRL